MTSIFASVNLRKSQLFLNLFVATPRNSLTIGLSSPKEFHRFRQLSNPDFTRPLNSLRFSARRSARKYGVWRHLRENGLRFNYIGSINAVMIIDKILPSELNGRSKFFVAVDQRYRVFDLKHIDTGKVELQSAVELAHSRECYYFEEPIGLARYFPKEPSKGPFFGVIGENRVFTIQFQGKKTLWGLCYKGKSGHKRDIDLSLCRTLPHRLVVPITRRFDSFGKLR